MTDYSSAASSLKITGRSPSLQLQIATSDSVPVLEQPLGRVMRQGQWSSWTDLFVLMPSSWQFSQNLKKW